MYNDVCYRGNIFSNQGHIVTQNQPKVGIEYLYFK